MEVANGTLDLLPLSMSLLLVDSMPLVSLRTMLEASAMILAAVEAVSQVAASIVARKGTFISQPSNGLDIMLTIYQPHAWGLS